METTPRIGLRIKRFVTRTVPLILGLMVWTKAGLKLYEWLLASLPLRVPAALGPRGQILVLCALLTLFSAWLYRGPAAFGVVLKLSCWPIYVLVAIVQWGWKGSTIFARLSRAFGSSVMVLPLTVLSAVGYAPVLLLRDPTILELISLYWLPAAAILSILWLHQWTFRPFVLFGGLGRFLDWFLRQAVDFGVRQAHEYAQKGNTRGVSEQSEALGKIGNGLRTLAKATDRFRVNPILVSLFVWLFFWVFVLVCTNFAFSYYGIYLMDPAQIRVSTGHGTLLDFMMLSLRALFFNDYVYITPIARRVMGLVLAESFSGVFLFVVLVMTFSAVTAEQGKHGLKQLKQELLKRADTVQAKATEVTALSEAAPAGEMTVD